jgi:hypothetical protein
MRQTRRATIRITARYDANHRANDPPVSIDFSFNVCHVRRGDKTPQ